MKNLVFAISFIFTFSSAIFSQIPTEGLVSYYPFNSSVNDESGNGNDLVDGDDAVFGTDRFGNSNSCLSLGDPIYELATGIYSNPDTLSFSFWMKEY